jgi:hypothetical protein
MATVAMSLRSLRNVLDRFCAEQGLPINSPASFDAARHCIAVTSEREFDEVGLLLQLRNWYKSYQTSGGSAAHPTPLGGSATMMQKTKTA